MSNRFFPCDQSAILAGYEHRKIMAVDVESDIKVGGMQVRLGRIAERWDLRSCQDDIARSGWTAGPALQQIAKMNGAKFILI